MTYDEEYEIADEEVNPDGYADDPDESDLRAKKRDARIAELVKS